ncbi:putative T7SS-secreted protein [Streptomyces ovatisporus]|uniref:T7SS-secreted protein n=1 Tax=Streptomyces ovatisporus TaxID=1128682 RepID=A0ABV9A8K0_9ACTN
MGLGEAFDNPIGAVQDGLEKVGDGVEWAGGKAADGLDEIGLEGAAEGVRDAGEWTADKLGADVAERQLGETEDPKEIIHGDVEKLTERAEHLRDFFKAFDKLGSGLKRLDVHGWEGEAGEAFRSEFEPQPKFWIQAADACESAAKQIVQYASTVEWAQGEAKEAVALYKKSKAASDKAVDDYNAKADDWNRKNESGGDPGPKPPPFQDPGKAGLERAQHMVREARSQRDDAARRAKDTMRGLVEQAPELPGAWETVKMAGRDMFEGMALNSMHIAGGALKGVGELVGLARMLNPTDPYNMTHPGQYAQNMNGVVTGLASTVAHPERLVGIVKNQNWRDPGEAFGKLLVDLAGGKGAGGAAKGGLKGALKHGVKEGAEQGARKTVKERLGDLARDLKCKVLRNEPVDMATGRMVLQETDVALPGSFPLALARTFESAYRLGGWFGPAWASTLDERLEVDAEGVVYVTADGSVRPYPHPAPGVPVLPEEGLPWPLDRRTDGSYTLTDPVGGLTRTFAAPEDAPPGGDGVARIAALGEETGGWASFEWDDETGAPLSVSHSGGYELKFECQGGRVRALSLAGGAPDGTDQPLKSYGYDEAGHLTAVTDSTGATLRYGVDERGRIVSWTDSNDRSFSYTYDDEDRCVFHTGEAGHLRTTFEYGLPSETPGHTLTRVTDSLGHTKRYLVDSKLRIVAETDANGHTTHTTYDVQHRPLTVTDHLGGTVRYTYDDAGRPLRVVLPDGGEVAVEYDEDGRPVRRTAVDGAEWRYARDERGLLTAVTDPAGSTTAYGYDARGHLASVMDPLGATSAVRCDRAGLPLAVTDPLGGTTAYVRDAFGRPVTVTDPSGAVTRLEWTPEGRLVRRVDPGGEVHTWTYDGEGNCLTHTDAAGGETRYEYTHFDLRTAQTGPDGVRHTFAYDTELRLVQVANPQGLTWSYTYDPAGRLISETDFDDRTLQYGHDAAGGLAFRTNPAGQTISFTRDAMGRVTRKNADGDATDYTYDAAGRLISAHGPDADLLCRRDKLGRVKDEAVNGRVLTHDYDPLGRRTRRVTPAGTVTTYTYDAAGNRTSLTTNGHTLTFGHDESGRETSRSFGEADLTFTSLWDPAGRLASQTIAGPSAGTVQRRTYRYRADSHLVGVEDQLNGSQLYDLDRAGRVTAVRAENWSETYAYDEAGNQTSADWPAQHAGSDARGERSYSGTKLLTAGSIRYEYDDAGRAVLRQKSRLSKKPDTWRYVWDGEDRLTSVVTPDGVRWRYLYDPLGRRIAKQRLGEDGQQVLEQVDFTWDGPTLIEQTTSAPNLPDPVTLTWDHDGLRPLTQTERITDETTQAEIDSRFFAIATDLVGAPTELLDESGGIAWRTRSTLWGTTTWNADATAYTPLRFPGQYADPETGLHYNFHRHYDPTTARYLSQDPLGLDPAPNPVTYVHNPHTWADPLGLKCEPAGSGNTDLPEGYTPSPALKGDPYHPDSVAERSRQNRETYGPTVADRAAELGYDRRIPAHRAPFNSHGQVVFHNGRNYITPDVDGHNVSEGWKMFNRRGQRIGTYDSDLNYVKE